MAYVIFTGHRRVCTSYTWIRIFKHYLGAVGHFGVVLEYSSLGHVNTCGAIRLGSYSHSQHQYKPGQSFPYRYIRANTYLYGHLMRRSYSYRSLWRVVMTRALIPCCRWCGGRLSLVGNHGSSSQITCSNMLMMPFLSIQLSSGRFVSPVRNLLAIFHWCTVFSFTFFYQGQLTLVYSLSTIGFWTGRSTLD